jgi:hypothetical protein
MIIRILLLLLRRIYLCNWKRVGQAVRIDGTRKRRVRRMHYYYFFPGKNFIRRELMKLKDTRT